MLLSMTGFGEAHCQRDGLVVVAEVRTINNRYLKVSIRAGEGYAALEPQIEDLLRQSIRRGTVQVSLRVTRRSTPGMYRINADVLAQYRQQLHAVAAQWQQAVDVPVESLLLLPGVVDDQAAAFCDVEADWPAIGEALTAALASLAQMRSDEGRAMAADLAANCRTIAIGLDDIERRAPAMIDGYRKRLEERLNKALAEYGVSMNAGDLVKEVALFVDRSDISEEIVRLRSHLDQFASTLELPESAGRKLEFLTQEMFREANTIGSKANDVEISKSVIEIKTAIERIREMIQNVE
jgi:uncharacterized protein (TIGR00255 family)